MQNCVATPSGKFARIIVAAYTQADTFVYKKKEIQKNHLVSVLHQYMHYATDIKKVSKYYFRIETKDKGAEETRIVFNPLGIVMCEALIHKFAWCFTSHRICKRRTITHVISRFNRTNKEKRFENGFDDFIERSDFKILPNEIIDEARTLNCLYTLIGFNDAVEYIEMIPVAYEDDNNQIHLSMMQCAGIDSSLWSPPEIVKNIS